MKTLRTPRFWLLTTAALIFGSHMSASAQVPGNYQSGAPTMVAAAPGLPSIPAEQIARDVTSDFNPRTGARELVAAPFDPFEEDPNLAGSLRLRSADGAVAIDGQTLRDGALVEVDFYYNSPSNDQHGGRNYSDASFVNGQLAPVVLRDTRILECSTRVDNVVYDHNSYYSRSPRAGIYRPYRHYAGHSGFGFGFGSSYFGPGYGYYDRGRSSRSRFNRSRGNSFRRSNSRRSSTSRRVLDAVRGGRIDSNDSRSDRNRDRNRNRNNSDVRVGATPTPRDAAPRVRSRELEERVRGLQSFGLETPNGGRNSNRRSPTPMRSGVANERIVVGAGPAATETQSSGRSNRSTRSEGRRSEGRRSEPRRTETRQSQPRRSETRRSEPRRSESRRSESRPARSSSSDRKKAAKRAARTFFDFFPNDGYGGRQVVTSRSVDCAREDKLRVFIPNDRLDAARFDGLTLVALDAQGGETPIYIPPNYIEGFRLAASGRIQPQGTQAAPVQSAPITGYPQQGRRIEAAPCPSGTSKQPDGTCLQNRTTGYISR